MRKCLWGLWVAAFAVLLAPVQAEEPPWSEPAVTLHEPGPGIAQKLEVSKRNFKSGPSQRTLENQIKVNLKTPGWEGDYLVLKKHVYSGARIVTFYRKLEGDVQGSAKLALSEQTQVAKNPKGDFKGTFVREYFLQGRESQGPAVRLYVHFNPYLLVKRFNAKIYARKPDGSWPEVAGVYGETLKEGIASLRREISERGKNPAGREPAADFLMALWSGAMAHGNTMEMAQFLYPIMNPLGEKLFQDVNTDLIIERSRAALASLGNRNEELSSWKELSKSLSRLRGALNKALGKKLPPPAQPSSPAQIAQRYAQAAKPLLSMPSQEAPSPLQGLQGSAAWMAAAYEEFSTLEPGSEEYRQFLADLSVNWAQLLSEQRSEVFLRALHVLLMNKEIRGLDPLIATAEKKVEPIAVSLKELKQKLTENLGAWRTPLAQRAKPAFPEAFLAFRRLPIFLPASEAWAEPQASLDELAGMPGDLTEFVTELMLRIWFAFLQGEPAAIQDVTRSKEFIDFKPCVCGNPI